MSPLTGREAAEKLSARTVGLARVIAAGTGASTALLIGMIALTCFQSRRSPSPEEIRLVNLATAFAAAAAVLAIFASDVVWKAQLRRADAGSVDAVVLRAFIVRTAMREGAALIGCVACLIAALNGALRARPVYWVDLGPAALFYAYLVLRWPSLDGLKAELISALPQ